MEWSKDLTGSLTGRVRLACDTSDANIQMIMAYDMDSVVRLSLAWSVNLVPKVQLVLARDPEEKVRWAVAINQRTYLESSIAAQRELARNGSVDVRRTLARSSALFDAVRDILLDDEDYEVVQNAEDNLCVKVKSHKICPYCGAVKENENTYKN